MTIISREVTLHEILHAINEYKDLSIECVLQKNELVVNALAEARAKKLDQAVTLIKLSQKDAAIKELNKAINEINFKEQANDN